MCVCEAHAHFLGVDTKQGYKVLRNNMNKILFIALYFLKSTSKIEAISSRDLWTGVGYCPTK